MIDISTKPPIKRIATAQGTIHLKPSTILQIQEGTIKKGDPITVGQIAAIQAAKQTPILLPHCHQIPLAQVDSTIKIEADTITVEVTVVTIAPTGVEMEALVGVSTFLNVIWDMTKYLEKDVDGQYPTTTITDIRVLSKEKQVI